MQQLRVFGEGLGGQRTGGLATLAAGASLAQTALQPPAIAHGHLNACCNSPTVDRGRHSKADRPWTSQEAPSLAVPRELQAHRPAPGWATPDPSASLATALQRVRQSGSPLTSESQLHSYRQRPGASR